MAEKPSYKLAHKERMATGSMEIEGAVDATKPKTSFSDKNLDAPQVPGDPAQKISSDTAKPGGSISPESNAPKQTSRGAGSTHVDPEGLTKT